jgi:glutamate-1-semialdehyde 2,1-aminomutase
MRKGQTFAMSNPQEQKVAGKIVAMCPGVQMVRFANSGTEATMHALCLARAYTSREKIVIF